MTAQVQSGCEIYLKQQLAAASLPGAKGKACKKELWINRSVCTLGEEEANKQVAGVPALCTAALSGHTRGLSKYQQL